MFEDNLQGGRLGACGVALTLHMEESSCPVSLRAKIDTLINFAIQQNDVPIVKLVRVENHSDVPLRDLEVCISVEPAFAETWSRKITSISPNDFVDLDFIDLHLSPGFLSELTERVRGRLFVKVRQKAAAVAQWSTSVVLLARNEWGGVRFMPETLAAFVLPNHPEIMGILRLASDILAKWTRNPSLGGYQSRSPRRAFQITAAIYAALQGLKLTYVSPPASFENDGQRVRLPDEILKSRMATCLEASLLAAACLEQAGLHPLVMLKDGHAFGGVWLHDDCFPESIVHDPLRIKTRVEVGQLAVFDPAFITYRPSLGFNQAVAEGNKFLLKEDEFVCALDVKHARNSRIRPLPVRVMRHGASADIKWRSVRGVRPPDIPSNIAESEHAPAQRNIFAPARIDRWRKLARLLRTKETKKSLERFTLNID